MKIIPKPFFVNSFYQHCKKLLLKYTQSPIPFNTIFKRDYCHYTIQTPYLVIPGQIRVMIPCIKQYRYTPCSCGIFQAKHFFQAIQDH